MSNGRTDGSNSGEAQLNRDGRREVVRGFVRPVVGLLVLLVSAGTIGWINAWIYAGMRLLYHVTYVGLLMKKNPELLNQRGRVKKNTKAFDKVILISFVPLFLLIQIVCGLDAVRFEWSGMSLGYIIFGVVIWAAGISFILWSMVANPHFEASVRIQEERDHRVFASGPYRIVRHPGYLGFITMLLSVPFILGSWWGLVPSAVFAVLIIIRTGLEDRMLKGELSGYGDYAKETRHRLLPFIW